LSKGGDLPPSFGKACLPVDRGGWEGFYKVISNSLMSTILLISNLGIPVNFE
jgi:hypothetical protein